MRYCYLPDCDTEATTAVLGTDVCKLHVPEAIRDLGELLHDKHYRVLNLPHQPRQ